MLYRCRHCLALCRQLVWAALGISEAEERCPHCHRWSQFDATAQAGQASPQRPSFTEKRTAAA